MRILLSEFDGRATTILTQIETKYGQDTGYVNSLIELMGDEDTPQSEGATWLLKAWLDKRKTFSESQTTQFLKTLPCVSSWQAQLHVCQSVRHLSVDQSDVLPTVDWLRALLHHKRPFLRAWSLDAIVAVASSHKTYADFAMNALKEAVQDDAASVRARARSLLKSFR